MGVLSKMHRRNRFRKPRPNRAPLRRVVGRETVAPPLEWGREILECGHRVFPRHDFIGETNAYRRRCRLCVGDADPALKRKE
jgi:hypothetical protein